MRNFILSVAALLALSISGTLHAELPVGTKAPGFTTVTAMAGKTGQFDLKSALARGPVVLYFFPKAFTQGCTLETRAFAEAHDKFTAAGATVLGLSADDIGTLKRFSVEECRSKFAVGVASPATIRAYDVALRHEGLPAGLSDRTSYVIGQDGRVKFVHSDLDYRDHVKLTLQAVQSLSGKSE